jgi:hypothetical protein
MEFLWDMTYNICLGSTPIFGGGPSVLHIFLFFRVVFYCFICLCPVSCVPSVAGVPGLSFRDWPFGFLKRLFSVLAHDHMQYVPRYYIVHVII